MRSEPTFMPKAPGGGCMKYYSRTKERPFPKAKRESSARATLSTIRQSTKKLNIYCKMLWRSSSNKLDHPPTHSSRLFLSCPYCHAVRLTSLWLAVLQAVATPPGRGAEEESGGCWTHRHPPPAASASQHPQGSATALGQEPAAAPWQPASGWAATPFYKRHGEQIKGYKHLRWKEENSFGLCKETSSAEALQGMRRMWSPTPLSPTGHVWTAPFKAGHNYGRDAGKCFFGNNGSHIWGHIWGLINSITLFFQCKGKRILKCSAAKCTVWEKAGSKISGLPTWVIVSIGNQERTNNLSTHVCPGTAKKSSWVLHCAGNRSE